jgi:hypothetical protein
MTAETPRQPAESSPEPPAGPERGTGEAGPEKGAETVYSYTVGDYAVWTGEAWIPIGAVRPVHYRVADSLDRLGHHDAARAVRSTAKDLEDGDA